MVLPWTVRNWRVFDAFVPVSTAGALNLWQGNTRLSREQVYEEYWAVRGRIPKYEHARRRAVEAILERQPLWILEKLRSELPEFWAAHAQPIVHLERGAYGPVRRPSRSRPWPWSWCRTSRRSCSSCSGWRRRAWAAAAA